MNASLQTILAKLPKPYYQDDQVSLFHADSRPHVAAMQKLDLVMTDPPYGMSYVSKSDKLGLVHGDKEPYDTEFLKLLIERSENAVYAFCRWGNLPEIIAGVGDPKSFIVWAKDNWTMGDLEHEYGRSWEGICFWANAKHQWGSRRPCDTLNCSRVPFTDMQHPTQKPVMLMTELLEHNTFDWVLDPYAGSGSTLVAAKQLGKHALGFEIEEKHCETIASRLKQSWFVMPSAQVQTAVALDLFAAPLPVG